MDTATSDIRAVEFTPGRDGDSPLLPDLRGQIPEDEQIGIVRPLSGHRVAMPCQAVDGAYDTRRSHTAILARGPTPIIPIRKNGRTWKEDCQPARAHNNTLRRRGTTEGHSGSAGRDTTPAAASPS
jgi:hypothetical protein